MLHAPATRSYWVAWENGGVSVDLHSVNLAGLSNSVYVRFWLLALSSIFFLVDPFAALPTFLAVTAGADDRGASRLRARRR